MGNRANYIHTINLINLFISYSAIRQIKTESTKTGLRFVPMSFKAAFNLGVIHIVRTHKGGGEVPSQMRTIAF